MCDLAWRLPLQGLLYNLREAGPDYALETQFSLSPPVGLYLEGTRAGLCCCPFSKAKHIIWVFTRR